MTVDLYLGDCLEILPTLEDNSVDAVITDPPYGVGIALWDEDLPPQYVLDECLRVSRGPVIWFGAAPRLLDFATYNPKPDRILIWSPKFTLSKIAKDGFAYRYHPIYIWQIEKQNAIPWDVLNDATECGNWWEHKATKPVSLMSKIVNAWGDTILDPFMGSGTTGVACVHTGRNFIGIEIEPKYYEIAEKRIAEAQLQVRMPI